MKDFKTTPNIELYQTDCWVVFLDLGIYQAYDKLFEQYEAEPSGYVWTTIINNYLKEKAPNLLTSLEFDPNGDEFWAGADTEENQQALATLLAQLLETPKKVEELLKALPEEDRSS